MYSARRGVVICAIGAVVALVVTALSVSPAAALTSPAGQVGSSSSSELAAPVGAGLPFPGSTQSVCGTPGVGVAQCLADVLKPSGTSPEISFPTGLSPLTIENVYGFSSTATAGTGQTIALVDAFDDSNAASDLNEFQPAVRSATRVPERLISPWLFLLHPGQPDRWKHAAGKHGLGLGPRNQSRHRVGPCARTRGEHSSRRSR